MELRCRHAAIASYFGDQKPLCNKSCDCCKNPRAAKQQVEHLQGLLMNGRSRTCIQQPGAPSGPFGYEPGLYEGGRKGYGFARYDEDSDGEREDSTDKRKQQWNSFFQKQMNMRKSKELEEFIPPSEDSPLRDGANDKIPKLTVKAREHCLKMLEEALSKNVQGTDVQYRTDVASDAVDLEYEVFRSSKMANVYKAGVLRKVAEINKASKEGELFSVSGLSNCAQKAEEKVDDEGFVPASRLNTCKGKRAGAPSLFQSASTLLQTSKSETRSPQTYPETTQHAEPGSDSPLPECTDSPSKKVDSPNKKPRTSKKKQELASSAAKDSQDISKFFSSHGNCNSVSGAVKSESPDVPENPSVSSTSQIHGAFNSDMSSGDQGSGEELSESIPGPSVSDKTDVLPSGKDDNDLAEQSVDGDNNTLSLHSAKTTDVQDRQIAEGGATQVENQERSKDAFCPDTAQEKQDVNSDADQKNSTRGWSAITRSPEYKRKASEDQQEHEEPSSKRQRREDKSSSILFRSEKGVGGHGKKKVTFDPNLSKEDKEGTAKILQPPTGNKVINLKETADIVVKYLTPFFRDGKFASKELFKGFARHLSHHLAGDNKTPKRKHVKEEAQKLIKAFFKNRTCCDSEADWQEMPQTTTTTATS